MHGLFGFVGDTPRRAPLAAVLEGAATGGSFAWSVAREELSPIPALQVDHAVERLDAAMEVVETSSCFIGNGGTTTDGPRVAGVTALVHSSLVEDPGASASRLERPTTNDIEALLQLVATSHGDLAVRVLAAIQRLPHRHHALLVMQPNVIVSVGQSAHLGLADDREGSVLAADHELADAHLLFYAQREEGTYFCSRRVLSEMHPVHRVTAFRLMS